MGGVDPVHPWHLQIHQHQIWREGVCLLDCCLPVRSSSYHGDALLVLKERPQSVEHQRLIVDDENGDVCHVTVCYSRHSQKLMTFCSPCPAAWRS